MKKIILIAGLLICGLTKAQTVTVTGNEETITDGETILFNSIEPGERNLDLVITNTSTENITIRMKVVSITNNATPNNNLQFCIQPQCFNTIAVGTTIPTNLGAGGIVLEPNQSTQGDNHFRNYYLGDDESSPVDYELAVITVDGDGNEVNQLMSFHYRYDANAADSNNFEALKNLGLNIKNTVINTVLEVEAQQNATLEVYNMNGQTVSNSKITTGNQLIDFSALATGIYNIHFTTEDNRTATIKVIKK